MKIFKLLFPITWLLALLIIGSFYFWGADHEASYYEEENRILAGVPKVGESLQKGSLDSDTENFLLDQFPYRKSVIRTSDSMRNRLSIASYDDFVAMKEGSKDPLDQGGANDAIQDILDELNKPTETQEATTEAPTQSVPDAESQTPEETEPQENPPITPKPPADINSFAEWMHNYMTVDDNYTEFGSYTRDSVLAFTAVLNKYAAALPKDGKLMFTMVPQATFANKFVNSSHNGAMKQDAIDMIQAFGADNVYAFDAAAILSEPIANNEYIFFRTDMHWTPYGSYLLYKQMAAQAGKIPSDYTNDYAHQTEDPFLGTYYRDYPSDYLKNNPDVLELIEPKFPHELRRIDGKDSYHAIPYLDFDAKSNDRYTVYLGGPAGPWTYVETDNDEEENALVIMDSFGLGYFSYLTNNYKQVHYYDPRYFDYYQVGYSVSEMIEKYNITDIYVVIGDLHSFSSDFILNYANRQFNAPE